jgi:hypothetical protein
MEFALPPSSPISKDLGGFAEPLRGLIERGLAGCHLAEDTLAGQVAKNAVEGIGVASGGGGEALDLVEARSDVVRHA